MSNAKPLPTDAQAKRLCRLFSDSRSAIAFGGHMDATDVAIVKRGWASDSGEHGKYPNGTVYKAYRINDDGMDALERYFWNCRLNRMTGGKPIFRNDGAMPA